ncbi:MAG: GntR family transcriptional regulator [Xenococcaceae cyanobacterium MO_188.B32]|nr:GntR family transcriptional regulator [Xenococcaceae cyanobacterium MO_188.B32]
MFRKRQSFSPANTVRLRKVVGLDKQREQEMQGSRGRRNYAYPNSIAAGMQLTPSRQLALELGISRYTVVSAYEELCAQGYCISRVGQGTVVVDIGQLKEIAPNHKPNHKTTQLPSWLLLESSTSEKTSPTILQPSAQSIISFEPSLAQTDYLTKRCSNHRR